MPTSASLVTNLPADFNTFGQAVDTSMSELLGGTTGQVLSKTSNTNMDFTWVTTDDANAIQNAIVDAKGDLIAASAADTPARLAVGTNYNVLSAQSAETTGLQWAGASTAYTPTWTADGTAPSLGNGTLSGQYIRFGNMCQVRILLTIGSTTTTGTFGWNFSLPFTSVSGNNGVPGNAYLEDAGVAGYRAQTYINDSLLYLQTTATNAKVGQLTPFAWATGDFFRTQFIFEVA